VFDVWSGAGSNRRPSAFQVNHAKRYANLQKRTSPTSETALGGRCTTHANRTRHARPLGSTAMLPEPCAKGWRPIGDCTESHYGSPLLTSGFAHDALADAW
jgi:hypothetical protein